MRQKVEAVGNQLDWLQSFLFYIYFSLYIIFFIMILFNPTSLPMAEQGTEVNKNSTSYTSVVSPQKKKKKKKKKREKEGKEK